ncbi:MAG: 3-dehydroquinate synthase II [Pseudomonadota bacterium]
MRKRFWVQPQPFDTAAVTAALEAGADALVIPAGEHERVQRLGRITTIADDGDLRWGEDVQRVLIENQEDERKVRPDCLNIIDNRDWSIIPLENLIAAGRGTLIQTVHSAEEAHTALAVMEQGADGVLLLSSDPAEIRRTGERVRRQGGETIALEPVQITETRPVALSDRCCIDTTSLLPPGEGLLVGNSADALFLVHNENVTTPYCDPRPFRVNAGAVHAYARQPDNRTRYLAELASGDELLACDPQGQTRVVSVGRNKIERRPMLLVRAQNAEGREVALVMQNAETVRLTSAEGAPRSITQLRAGDQVLAAFFSKQGRHFGTALEESIEER